MADEALWKSLESGGLKVVEKNWMIYGAYGYTGRLIAEEAIRRGHKPVLAGRSARKLQPLAERLGVGFIVLDLQDEKRLHDAVRDFDLIFHAAGPYGYTSAPMVQACLNGGANYLDICAEPLILEWILSLDALAREKRVALIPGAGFDVIATDCLALHVTQRITHPTHLEIATAASFTSVMSPGSAKTFFETVPTGIMARRNGRLVRISAGGVKRIRFLDRERTVVPASLGDLVTAHRTSSIPDVATYTALPEKNVSGYVRAEPIYRKLFAIRPLRRIAQKIAEKTATGPDEHLRQTDRSHVWVKAHNEDGLERQGWLETMESYRFTAVAGVRAAEEVITKGLIGALTPALAFGADFLLEIPDSRCADKLEERSGELSVST